MLGTFPPGQGFLPPTGHGPAPCSSHVSRHTQEDIVKGLTIGVLAVVSLAPAGSAFAFSCPTLVKAANEAIAKAEPMAMKATDDRQKARDMGKRPGPNGRGRARARSGAPRLHERPRRPVSRRPPRGAA